MIHTERLRDIRDFKEEQNETHFNYSADYMEKDP